MLSREEKILAPHLFSLSNGSCNGGIEFPALYREVARIMVEMDLVEIQISGENGSQVIILREKEGTRCFPIIIGNYEVIILDQTVRNFETSRPLTHDLVLNVIEGLGGMLTGILVDDLRDNAFIGKLLVKKSDGTSERIDTRPSDAIVLATKKKVPIYVEEHVLESAKLEEDDNE